MEGRRPKIRRLAYFSGVSSHRGRTNKLNLVSSSRFQVFLRYCGDYIAPFDSPISMNTWPLNFLTHHAHTYTHVRMYARHDARTEGVCAYGVCARACEYDLCVLMFVCRWVSVRACADVCECARVVCVRACMCKRMHILACLCM